MTSWVIFPSILEERKVNAILGMRGADDFNRRLDVCQKRSTDGCEVTPK